MYFGNLATAVSLRKCFYLSTVVLVLSTMMAAVIIVKLSPLESVKCQPQAATPAVEWSTLANKHRADPLTVASTHRAHNNNN